MEPLMGHWNILRKIAIAIFLLIITIFVIAPPITSIILSDVLEKAGADQAEIGDININPLMGRVELFDVHLRDDGSTILALDHGLIRLNLFGLFDRKLKISELQLKGAYVDLVEKDYIPLGVRGLDFEQQEEAIEEEVRENPWTVGIDNASISNTYIDIETQKISSIIGIEEFELRDIFTWDKEHPTGIIAKGSINKGLYDIDLQLKPLAALRSVTGHIKVDQISLKDIHPLIVEQVPEFAGIIALDSEIEVSEPEPDQWQILIDASLNAKEISVGLPDISIRSDAISYQGNPLLRLDLSTNDEVKLVIEESGTGRAENTALSIQDLQLGVEQLNISARPENTEQDSSGLPEALLTIEGKSQSYQFNKLIEITGFTLRQDKVELNIGQSRYEGNPKITLASITDESETIGITIDGQGFTTVSGLVFRTNGLQLQTTRIDANGSHNIFIEPEKKPVFKTVADVVVKDTSMTDGNMLRQLSIARTEINDVRFTGTRTLAIKSIELDKLAVEAEVKKSSAKKPAADSESEPQKKTDSDTRQSTELPVDIRLGKFSISKDSYVAYSDAAVTPEFNARMVLNRFLINNINTGDKGALTSVDIDTTINRYAKLSSKGTVRPFKGIPDVDLENSIRGVNLTRVTPYTTKFAGYDITNGSMNVDSNLSIQDNQINDTVKLKINNLDMNVSNQEKASEIDAKLAISLPRALGLLKDSNDDIKLSLPISGDLSDPNFDFSHAITVVVSKALAKGATVYAAYALQPWGAALIVKEVAGKMITQVQLDPITYEPTSPDLPESATPYLQKISGLLTSRPGMELKICGVGNEADRNALIEQEFKKKGGDVMEDKDAAKLRASIKIEDQQLLALAQQRMFGIKDILIEKHKVPQDRIQTCLVKMSKDPATGSVVNLQI
jgi:hypothetical protein